MFSNTTKQFSFGRDVRFGHCAGLDLGSKTGLASASPIVHSHPARVRLPSCRTSGLFLPLHNIAAPHLPEAGEKGKVRVTQPHSFGIWVLDAWGFLILFSQSLDKCFTFFQFLFIKEQFE